MLFSKMYEALLVGAGSSAIGVLLAHVWAFPLGAPGLREVLSGWSAQRRHAINR